MAEDHKVCERSIDLDDQTQAQLSEFATELAEDYTGYLKVDCFQESRKLQEKTDDYIGILERFCNTLESIRQDSAICLEEHLPAVVDKSRQIQKLYDDIDRIEAVVATVKKTVDDMDKKVTEAETALGKPVIIRRLFNTLFGSSPKKTRNNTNPATLQYVEPYIFKSSDYFFESNQQNHSEDAIFSAGSTSDDPDEEILVVRSHRSKKSSVDK